MTDEVADEVANEVADKVANEVADEVADGFLPHLTHTIVYCVSVPNGMEVDKVTRWLTWWSSMWVTNLERLKSVKDDGKQARTAKSRTGPGVRGWVVRGSGGPGGRPRSQGPTGP